MRFSSLCGLGKMKKQKPKTLQRAAIAAAAMTSVSASAEVLLTENLSLTGFLDMSATNVDTDGAGSESTASIDQFEVDFLFSQDKLTGQVDLNYLGGDSDVALEQAHIGYALSDNFSIKAGKFLSVIGFESFEPTGLYQYSSAVSTVYPGHHTGIAGVYSGDAFGVYASVVDGTWSADNDPDDLGYEVQLFTSPVEGLTLKLGYASEDFGAYDKSMLNFWTSYEVGSLTLAAEYSDLDEFDAADNDGDAYMVMGNYAFTERFATTLRYAELDTDLKEVSGFTVSPSYSLSDSWTAIAEYTHLDYDLGGADQDVLALELLFTF